MRIKNIFKQLVILTILLSLVAASPVNSQVRTIILANIDATPPPPGSNIFIVYRGGLKLNKSNNGGATWDIRTIDAPGDWISSHVVGTNNIYVSYRQGLNLRFAKSTDGGDSWTTSTLHVAIHDQHNTAIYAVDANTIYIASMDMDFAGNRSHFRFFRSIDGGVTWTVTLIQYQFSLVGPTGLNLSIHAVDASLIYISFYNHHFKDVRLAKSIDGGATWSITVVDPTGNTDIGGTSIYAVDAANIYISYRVWAVGLRVAKSTNGGVSWTITIVESGYMGLENSIYAVDINNIHISYHDEGTHTLKFAKSTNGGISWTVSTIDTPLVGAAGRFSSIHSVDVNTIYISYIKSGVGLRFAKSVDGGASWTFSNLDIGGSGFTSMSAI